MMSPQPMMAQQSPIMSPQPMRQQPIYQEPPRQSLPMAPQHYKQPVAQYREEPAVQYREEPVQYREAAPQQANVQYEQEWAPAPQQHVRFEAAAPQAQCAPDRSPQQQPMAAQFVQEVEVPKVITAPSAPPCELGGFREFIVEETRPVV